MKKLVIAVTAAMLMIFSAVPAFATCVNSSCNNSNSVNSPVAKPPCGTTTKECIAPKTGIDNKMLYVIIGLSALACGTSAVALAKTSKTSKK